jgi:hypothetical protein
LLSDTEPLQAAGNEAPGGKLVLQTRVRLKAHLGFDGCSIALDQVGEHLRAIGGKATLHQKLDVAGVVKDKFGLKVVPQGAPGFP